MHDRLHRARLERGLDLAELSARTAIAPSFLRRIDEGRFEELPPGIYARAYVRAFASAVGLDPERAVEDVAALLPSAPDPFPVLREVQQTPPRSRSTASRCAAATVDAAMLIAIALSVIRLVAYACGVSVDGLLQQQAGAVAVVCTVPMTLYFVLFGGIGGRTPGAAVCRLPHQPSLAPLGLNDVLLRALR